MTIAEAPNHLVLVEAAPQASRQRSLRRAQGTLAERTWLVRAEGSGTRAATEELLEELGIDPLRHSLGSNGAIRAAALVGLGVALLSRAAVSRELAEGCNS